MLSYTLPNVDPKENIKTKNDPKMAELNVHHLIGLQRKSAKPVYVEIKTYASFYTIPVLGFASILAS